MEFKRRQDSTNDHWSSGYDWKELWELGEENWNRMQHRTFAESLLVRNCKDTKKSTGYLKPRDLACYPAVNRQSTPPPCEHWLENNNNNNYNNNNNNNNNNYNNNNHNNNNHNNNNNNNNLRLLGATCSLGSITDLNIKTEITTKK